MDIDPNLIPPTSTVDPLYPMRDAETRRKDLTRLNRKLRVAGIIALVIAVLGIAAAGILIPRAGVGSTMTAIRYEVAMAEGDAAVEDQRYEAAIAAYQRATEADPEQWEAWHRLAMTHRTIFQFDEAIPAFDRALELNPDLVAAYLNRGHIYFDQGNMEKALADYNEVLRLEPENERALYQRGIVYMRQRKFEDAIADFEQIIALYPDLSSGYVGLGLTRRDQGDYTKAIDALTQAIEREPDSASYHYERGVAYQFKGDQEAAIEDYTRAIELDADYSAPYHWRGTIYRDQKKYAEALEDFDKALTVNANCRCGLVYADRARLLIQQEKYQEALADFDRAIEMDPASATFHYERGMLRVMVFQTDLALEDLTRCIELDPNHVRAHIERGFIYNDSKRYEEALADWERALELDPNNIGLLDNLASARAMVGDHEGAIAGYDQVLAMSTDQTDPVMIASAHYYRGISLRALGRYDEAMAEYDFAIEQFPAFTYFRQARASLKVFLGDVDGAILDLEEAIANRPTATRGDLSEYELAWIHYQRGDYLRMLPLLDITRTDEWMLKSALLNLDTRAEREGTAEGDIALVRAYLLAESDPQAALVQITMAFMALPDGPLAYYVRAQIEEKLGEHEQALTDYQSFLSRYTMDDSLAADARSRIAALQAP